VLAIGEHPDVLVNALDVELGLIDVDEVRPATAFTALSFALMNAMFVAALVLGSAPNAILLQYTAPLWMYVFCVWGLGEPANRRGAVALAIGLLGIGVIVWGGWEGGQLPIILLGLGSGVGYAAVVLGLRMQRDASSIWLTVVNHLFGGLVLLPFLWGKPMLSLPQLAWLFAFGALQMGLPYVLVVRSGADGRELDRLSVTVGGGNVYVLNDARPLRDATGHQQGWFEARADYIFEAPPETITMKVRRSERSHSVVKTYLLREPPPWELIPCPLDSVETAF
jgi:EamA-like transporter family